VWFVMLTCGLLGAAASPASPKHDKKIPAARWDEQTPGCTFSQGPDGKLRYGMSLADVAMVVAVDAQELEKVHRRHEPFFAVLLEMRNRGGQVLEVKPDKITLEFVQHFQVEQPALDPDDFSQKIQNDADALNDQAAREVKKSPEKKGEKETFVRAYLKDSAELQEFVGKNSLRTTQLDAANPETSGWVLFSTKSKWIGGWKKQEDMILRVPLGGKIYEFPFTLPPKAGQVLLRKR
jgi:hypothetical protein